MVYFLKNKINEYCFFLLSRLIRSHKSIVLKNLRPHNIYIYFKFERINVLIKKFSKIFICIPSQRNTYRRTSNHVSVHLSTTYINKSFSSLLFSSFFSFTKRRRKRTQQCVHRECLSLSTI